MGNRATGETFNRSNRATKGKFRYKSANGRLYLSCYAATGETIKKGDFVRFIASGTSTGQDETGMTVTRKISANTAVTGVNTVVGIVTEVDTTSSPNALTVAVRGGSVVILKTGTAAVTKGAIVAVNTTTSNTADQTVSNATAGTSGLIVGVAMETKAASQDINVLVTNL